MKTHQTTDSLAEPFEESIAEDAAGWLICFQTQQFSPDDPYRDPAVRNAAFFEWVKCSPVHLLLFMEMMELERRFHRLDARALADIRRLMEEPSMTLATVSAQEDFPTPSVDGLRVKAPWSRSWTTLGLAAAGCAAATFLYLSSSRAEIYTTPVGQQQRYVLKDGSAVQLNTDTEIVVKFSGQARSVVLVRGEAFFSIKHDVGRPFTVSSGTALIQDLGTEFDVRQHPQSISVSVISGEVQVGAIRHASMVSERPPEANTTSSPPAPKADGPLTLAAGEMAEITAGRVIRVSGKDVQDETAWRQKRLIFRKARLAEAVAEFNRYNPAQILIEGASTQDIPVSGIFDIGGYQDFLRYVEKLPALSVTPEGNHWVIRSRS
jgi:transmembrane sensor